METYRTSFNFSTETRPKLTQLQSLLQEKTGKSTTKAQAVEDAINYLIKELTKDSHES